MSLVVDGQRYTPSVAACKTAESVFGQARKFWRHSVNRIETDNKEHRAQKCQTGKRGGSQLSAVFSSRLLLA